MFNFDDKIAVVAICALGFGLGMIVGNLDPWPESHNETVETTTSVSSTTCTDVTTTATSITSYTTSESSETASTTTETTTEPETTTVMTTTTAEPRVITEPVVTETKTETTTETVAKSEEFIGTFSRGTYYTFGSYGGSGRPLVSGYSIASRALYERYGYGDYKIRIECDEFPELNGIYSLDDCSAPGNYEVIDFWFAPGSVPGYFSQMGVLEVRAYIVY